MLLKEILRLQVTPTDAEKVVKRQCNVVCIYYSGEWPNKLRLSKHQHRGYMNVLFYIDSTKHVQLPVYFNFKSPRRTKS
jgi:hypothetical protein